MLQNPYAEFGGKVALQPLPNEVKSAKSQTGDGDSAHTSSTPDLKTTVEFMGRMAEPEHRLVLLGELKGAELRSSIGYSLTIVLNQDMMMAATTGKTYKNGYPEFTYTVLTGGDGKQYEYPRYISFSLGSIDPSSIQATEGGWAIKTLSDFWDEHPKCEANPECFEEYLHFLQSAPKLTVVQFHTTDLKPLIERGGCPKSGVCASTDVTAGVMMFFDRKDRAERFITALTYAVKLEGGKPDAFPPTR